MRLGVIDCGTNTFHLLIVDVNDMGHITRVHKERRYVRLGQEGLSKIGAAPFQRGIACLADYKKLIGQLDVKQVKVFGTEALRRASNRHEFIQAVEHETGIRIQLITGDEEARLIHIGVMQAVPPFEGIGLIMDIGGGSVEFILASEREVYWAKSFPIGVQVLFSDFHKEDPLPEAQINAMEAFFEKILEPLFKILQVYKPSVLIGASGSFEVVENLHFGHTDSFLHTVVPSEGFHHMYMGVIRSSLPERYSMEGLPAERAELIVVAFVLIHYIIKKTEIPKIITSAYAMKEGILLEMMRKLPNISNPD